MKVKTINKIALLIGCLAMSSGCATATPDAALDAYEEFITQQRTFTCLRIEAADGASINITGIKTLEIESPLQHLSAIPPSENIWGQLIDKAGNVAMAFGGFELLRGAVGQQATVVQQPSPLIVYPEVVGAP